MASGFLHKRENDIYYARFIDKSGRERWKSLKTTNKGIAQAKLADILRAIEKEEVGWRLTGKPIREFLKQYLALCETEHAKSTYRVEKQILEEFIQFIKAEYLHQITADRLEAFKVKRAKDVSKSTVNRTITVIKAFLNRAMALGFLDRNPAQFVKKLKEEQRQIEFLSDTEIKKLLKVCSPRVRQIVTIFLLTGMRLGELAHLRWKDVDFRHKQIIIQNRPDWTTKNYKPRVIPMHEIVQQIFESLPKGKHELIFATSSGKPIESYLRAEVLRYAKKADVTANIKMFRSTFASNLAMKGVDIYVVSKLLGHHDVKITEKHYAHLTPNFLEQSVARLQPLLK